MQSPLLVEAPNSRRPARGGLLAVADIVDSTDPHLANGVTYEGVLCGPAAHHNAQCLDDVLGLEDEPFEVSQPGVVEAGPFGIYRAVECSPVSPIDYEALARDGLALGEAWAVERGVQIALLNQGTVYGGGAALPVVEAVAVAEQIISEQYGGLGLIHVSRYGATYLVSEKAAKADSDWVLHSGQGTPIANGGGYGALGPDDVTAGAGEFWLYATGPLTLFRGPVEYLEGDDAFNNVRTGKAVRFYAPAVECLTVAILVQAADIESEGAFSPAFSPDFD